jgi:endonuclease/exonuclease/phosphatase family metal-dependent hydrolase
MSRRPLACLLLTAWICCLAPAAGAAEHVRLVSFNIAEFGEGSRPETRDLDGIADLLSGLDADLIALQEVGVNAGGDDQVAALTGLLNDRRADENPLYFSLVTPRSGDERCAVIFRDPVVQEGELVWLDEDLDAQDPAAGGRVFYRIPVAVPFTVNATDFYVVICHLAWGDLERRTRELAALQQFLEFDAGGEGDWIVLGDLNRYGKYDEDESEKAFDRLLVAGWRDLYRFPLLEAVTDPDDMQVWRADEDAWSTTIADSRSLYDQFIVTAGAFPELDTDAAALDEHVGVLAFDLEAPYDGIAGHNELKYLVSDHRPVWLRLRSDLDDDD